MAHGYSNVVACGPLLEELLLLELLPLEYCVEPLLVDEGKLLDIKRRW
jgi:hypothetical protein